MELSLEHDPDAGVTYMRLAGHGPSVRQDVRADGRIIVDVNADGEVVGVEVFHPAPQWEREQIAADYNLNTLETIFLCGREPNVGFWRSLSRRLRGVR